MKKSNKSAKIKSLAQNKRMNVSAQIERRRSIKIQGFLPRLSGHIMRFFVQKLQYFWPNNA